MLDQRISNRNGMTNLVCNRRVNREQWYTALLQDDENNNAVILRSGPFVSREQATAEVVHKNECVVKVTLFSASKSNQGEPIKQG